MCDDYLKSFHKLDLLEILENEDSSKHFSINIDFLVLYEHQPDLVVCLLNDPEVCLEAWKRATLMAQMALLKEAHKKSQLKNNVHCRIYNLPFWPDVRRIIFPGNNDAGKFLQISGTVMRLTSPKLLEYQRSYLCVKCKMPSMVKAGYDRKYIIKQPKKCENPEGCSSTNLVHFGELDSENCRDYQEIKIQEQMKKLSIGSMPNSMLVTFEDDLVDSCKPGDNVTICGIVKRRWGEFDKGRKIDIDLVFKANHVQVDNSNSAISASTPEMKEMFNSFWEKYADDPLEGRDFILRSFCPQISDPYPKRDLTYEVCNKASFILENYAKFF
ncbi:hypothetical protein JTB14_020187 [Gonioctena quinquepunctata]|nr:hypothetical protein JTB14_020187 [Gonioctena quinquepunctata]